MKVYILFESKYEYSSAELIGVYSSKEKAELAAKKCRYRYYIKECDVH